MEPEKSVKLKKGIAVLRFMPEKWFATQTIRLTPHTNAYAFDEKFGIRQK